MIALTLLSVIVVASVAVFWLIPWIVCKLTRGVYTVRPLGLVCFIVMTLLVVAIGYACIFGGESFSNLERPGSFLIVPFLWIGSAWGMIAKTPAGKLAHLQTRYKRFLETNDMNILMEMCGDFFDEESIALLKKHPAEGKMILENSLRVLNHLETHPNEEPISPAGYYFIGRFYEEGIDGKADLSRALEMYTKARAVACPNPEDREAFEEYYTLAKKHIDELTNK